MSHTPSKYQQDIYNQLVTTNKNIAISATAGSGKSYTIVEAAKLVPYGKKVVFIAFNNHIVKSLKKKLPQNVDCHTLHSLGFKCIRENYQSVSLHKKKQIDYIEPLFKTEVDQRKKWKKIYAIDKIMSLARATMTKPNKDDLNVLAGKYALDTTEEETAATIKAMRKFSDYNEEATYDLKIDFIDMIGICALQDLQLPRFDYIFLDEAQDLSLMDRTFINKIVKSITGRKIISGDKNQAIYSFRGSDLYSFTNFVKEPNTIELPLTVSYRCAKAIVREAKKVYPEIEEWEEAEEGLVRKGKIEEITEKDFVLCRNTAPLIDVFLQLIDKNKKAYVVGKEMEQGLLGILSSLDASMGTDVWEEFKQREKEKIFNELQAKGIKNPLNHPKYGIFIEKISILTMLFKKFAYIYEIEEFIKEIFEYDDDEDREGTKLCTIHRAKGLENDRVFVIKEYEDKELIPSPYAVTEDMLIAERNLSFVAITRAKKELIYLYL